MWNIRQKVEFSNALLGEVVIVESVNREGGPTLDIGDSIVGLVTRVLPDEIEVTCKQSIPDYAHGWWDNDDNEGTPPSEAFTDKITVFTVDSNDVWHEINLERNKTGGSWLMVTPVWHNDLAKLTR